MTYRCNAHGEFVGNIFFLMLFVKVDSLYVFSIVDFINVFLQNISMENRYFILKKNKIIFPLTADMKQPKCLSKGKLMLVIKVHFKSKCSKK